MTSAHRGVRRKTQRFRVIRGSRRSRRGRGSSGIEKDQAFGLGAAEKERQFGAGGERGAGRGLEFYFSAAREGICRG